jgi:hypothetical protein
MIAEESLIQSIQTSCSTALPVNLDIRESATAGHCRIQSNWQEEMTGNDRTKWINCHKVCNPPEDRGQKAPATIIPVQKMQKMNVPLKRFRSFGISSKKVVSSTSMAVAPYVISISKI